MRKRVLFIMAVVMALSTAAPAASFWAGLWNAVFHWGPGSEDNSSYGVTPNAGGYQYGAVQGAPAGGGVVLQAEGAAGYQQSEEDVQRQAMIAGMGQYVGAANGGSATGYQAGYAGQTLSNGGSTQGTYVAGSQYAYVSTSPGSSASVTQTSVVLVEQSQGEGSPP